MTASYDQRQLSLGEILCLIYIELMYGPVWLLNISHASVDVEYEICLIKQVALTLLMLECKANQSV